VPELGGLAKKIPFIILSTQAQTEAILKAKQAGADDFLVKPVPKDVLVAKLKANLEKYAIVWPTEIDFDELESSGPPAADA
jgi:DNA-binding response OmpR family regulator